jgi:nucleoside-triphosphatase THEP1
MKEIQIIVVGEAAVGKSTMVLWLEKQLKKKGFLVEIDMKNEIEDYGNETQFRYTVGFNTKATLKKIKNERKIILKSMQMKNAFTKNENTEEEAKASDNK